MARKCFMCGKEIQEGILCEKCDKPRSKKSSPNLGAELTPEQLAHLRGEPAPQQAKEKAPPQQQAKERAASPSPAPESQPSSSGSYALDPFPKAPIVPFPVESASPAVTSVVNLLV